MGRGKQHKRNNSNRRLADNQCTLKKSERRQGYCVAIGAKGDGIIQTKSGIAYAPYTAPGDEGVFDIIGDRAKLVSLSKESSEREKAPCPHYGICGGCQLQHLAPEYYIRWKFNRVRDVLVGAGFSEEIIRPLITTSRASRRRAVLAVQKSNDDVVIGFNVRRSGEITPIDNCMTLHPELVATLSVFRDIARVVPAHAFDLAVTNGNNGIDVDVRSRRMRKVDQNGLATLTRAIGKLIRNTAVIRVSMNGEPIIIFDEPIVRFGECDVALPPGGFLQASLEGEEKLAELVIEGLRKPYSNKNSPARLKYVADLFCGSGTFTLRLAHFASVYAADSNGPSLKALRQAVVKAANAIKPVTIEARNLDERPILAAALNRFDAVIFDPPRSGAMAQASELANAKTKTVIGVSCNPSTFVRDARLLSQGGYSLKYVTPVDQFVYASHVELVGVFEKA